MPHWEFDELPASLVESELTQRDQFNNDDVNLAEALVREVIQNSSDARHDTTQPVKVRFGLTELTGDERSRLANLFEGLRPHLDACEIGTDALSAPRARVLVIEDFNTLGLTGSVDALDEEHFRNFWRRHGKSGKRGKAGGRWGLGKLVYSSSSAVRSFYGLTVRENEPAPLLLGQAVLANHELNGRRHPPHGFWFDSRGPGPDHLQLPVSDPETTQAFRQLVGISRTDQSGLSIAIPYVSSEVSEATVLRAVVNNYYFPILAGRLVVEVGDRTTVDRNSFRDVAAEVNRGAGEKSPFDFVEEVNNGLERAADITATTPLGKDGPLSAESFSADDLESLKQRYAQGEMVHVEIPVMFRTKAGEARQGAVRLFLRMRPENLRSYALFARGPITLPGERRYFQNSPALGALVATEGDAESFLGDAENPAHTAWNANAEKLARNWRNAPQTLKNIRHSLRLLHDLVAEKVETRDEEALMDFFAVADRGRSDRKQKPRTPAPKPDIPARPKAITIQPRKGGFVIAAGPGAAEWELPRVIRIRIAYDMIGANPFKHHSRFDFDLTQDPMKLEAAGGRVRPVAENVLTLTVHSPEFRLEAGGFDVNRDLIVDARAT